MTSGSVAAAARKFDVGEFFRERELLQGEDLTADRLVDLAAKSFESLGLGRALDGWDRTKFVFRGQLDESWGLTSTLARETTGGRLEAVTESRLCRAERLILDRARDKIEGSASGAWLGRNMSDGELLAVLQHQEAPTRFVDVSDDALVALFFAAEKEDVTDGRVFIIGLHDPEGLGQTETADEPAGLTLDLIGTSGVTTGRLPWPHTITAKNTVGSWTNTVYLVDPGSLDPRMRAQKGRFLVGGLVRAYSDLTVQSKALGRALAAEELRKVTSFALGFRRTAHAQTRVGTGVNGYAWSVRVPGELKPGIRKLLKDEYQVSRDSLYPEYKEFKRLAQHLARSIANGEGR